MILDFGPNEPLSQDWATRARSSGAYVPTLYINYSGGTIPEPGTLLLLGTGVLGAMGLIRRKRMG
jgi:hypothetical protein